MVMDFAKQFARKSQFADVNSGHVLMGLLAEGSGIAANVLKNLGMTVYAILDKIEKTEYARTGVPGTDLPWTNDAVFITKRALEEAQKLGHLYVGTEHLLLAICTLGGLEVLRDGGFLAGEILSEYCSGDLWRVRNDILSLLGHSKEKKDEPAKPKKKPVHEILQRVKVSLALIEALSGHIKELERDLQET